MLCTVVCVRLSASNGPNTNPHVDMISVSGIYTQCLRELYAGLLSVRTLMLLVCYFHLSNLDF